MKIISCRRKVRNSNQDLLLYSWLIRTLALAMGMLFLIPCNNSFARQQLHVELVNGSSIQIQVSNPVFKFNEIRPNETVNSLTFNFQDVREIRFTPEPIAKMRAKVERLLTQLISENYFERENAEELLGKLELGGRFRLLIRAQTKNASREMRYRVKRILEKLAESDNWIPAQRDLLILKNGRRVSGDASVLAIDGIAFGETIHLVRDQLLGIRSVADGDGRLEGSVDVKTFVSHADRFYGNSDIQIGFENDPFEKEFALSEKLNDAFVPLGLKIGTESPRYSRTSAFVFASSPVEVGQRSLCVFNPDKVRRFEGALEFTFCLPGQPKIAAGVSRFGVFIGEIDHTRDFVVEAFDASGQVLGMVSSTDENCCFAGFESNIQIAKIRIHQNPYLNTRRKLDRFYVADNVTFDSPTSLIEPRLSQLRFARLKNGDIVSASQFEFGGETVKVISPDFANPIEIVLRDIDAIKPSIQSVSSKKDEFTWCVMTKDGSILNARISESFEFREQWNEWFEPAAIIGAWRAQAVDEPARAAAGSDFEQGKPVLVFPNCRILADGLEIDSEKMFWNEGSESKFQTVIVANRESLDALDDVVPAFNQIEFKTSSEIPTIWFSSPHVLPISAGSISLATGEKILLGKKSGITIESIDNEKVVISKNGNVMPILFDKILSIKFPK